MSQSLTDRYDDRIAGMLSCYDRVVITGTIPVICYAEGMTHFLFARGIRIFDYASFAQKLRDRVRDAAVSLAVQAGVSIEHIAISAPVRALLTEWCEAVMRPVKSRRSFAST